MKKLVRVLSIFSLFVAFCAPLAAWGAELQIGVVDMRKVMSNSNEAKAVMEKLQNEFKPKEEKIIKLDKELKEDSEKLQRNAAIMGESEKAKLERDLISKKREFQRLQEEIREDSTVRQQEEFQKLIEKVQKVVSSVAEKEKLDLVLHQDTYVFHSSRLDITDKVIKALGQS